MSMLYPINSTSRRAVSLNGLWGFRTDPKSEGLVCGWQNGLPAPDSIPVPASFADFYTDKEMREYCGDFWYQTEVFVPEEWQGKRVSVRFGCATHLATVYCNGVEITSHEGGFLPFTADITEAAHFGRENRIVVRMNNELSETRLPCGAMTVLPSGRKIAKPYFDFYNYSGLQRNVFLTAEPRESITGYSVRHTLLGADAEVAYEVQTNGEHAVTVELADEAGNVVALAAGHTGVLTVRDAKLWKVRDAYLYTIRIRIADGERVIDEYAEPIGIRTVEVRGRQILLNGEPVYLKGFGKHEDSDIVGRGFNIGVMKRDFELMKWIGANCFRTSHYPYSEEIYQMADREGILIIDEVQAVGCFESLMNFAEASSGKRTAFFAKETTPQLLAHHLHSIEEMIERDKNHACVIAWSLLNEPDTTDPSAKPYFEAVFAKARELDPQKRPRTFALLMNSKPGVCQCHQYADFLSLNRYYGWYLLGGAELELGEAAFRSEMDAWQEAVPDKPLIFTEYGADTDAAYDKLPSTMWSESYQIEYLEMCHRVFDSYPGIVGELVWNFADFQTTEGIMRVGGNKKGIFTRQRQPKRAAFYFKERWESLPLDYKA
ncbi:MAG: beta-glucuronidase [Eubacteriales bacterium]|nr:beta-glucuronidase [Eubacteriales bacterium]